MDEKQIEEIKEIFANWDPLKTVGKLVEDLDDYNTEAIDFLFHTTKNMTEKSLENLAINIIEEAFEIIINPKTIERLGKDLYNIVQKY